MRLSIKERQIVALAALAADSSATEIAKKLRLPLHQIHYLVKKLTEAGIIRKVWVIDTFRLGFTRYNIFFSLNSVQQKTRASIVRSLAESGRTVFFSEI